MLGKACLWIRKYLRHIIIAIAIGVFIALIGVLLVPLLNIDTRKPLVFDSIIGILFFLLVIVIVSILWFHIPLPRIQQEKNPTAWISAEIESLEHDISSDKRADFRVIFRSELPFTVHMNYLMAQAIIDGKDSPSIVDTKSSIKIPKHEPTVLSWRLVNSPLSLYGVTIQLTFIGQDMKDRNYKIVTKPFASRPMTIRDRTG